jgi:hypothetical protein
MSTKNQQVQTSQFAPGSLLGYMNGMNTAKGLVNNPYGNPFYQQTLTQGVNAANAMNQTSQSNTSSYIANSGIGANSPAAAMLRQMSGYQGSHNTASAFMNASGQASNMFGMGMNYLSNPLRTGMTGTTTTSGLGTWLPQVAGAALGAAAGGFAGGKGFSLLGALTGAAGKGNTMGGYTGSMPMMPMSNGGGSGFGGFSGPAPSAFNPNYFNG